MPIVTTPGSGRTSKLCRLESSHYIEAGVTIRVTVDPGGLGYVSDYAFVSASLQKEITLWLEVWTSELRADLITAGMSAGDAAECGFALTRGNDGYGFVLLQCLGYDYDIDFSFTGDGSAIASWLGADTDLTGYADDTAWPSPAALFWPALGAQAFTRTAIARDRMQRTILDATTTTQHGADVLEFDTTDLEVRLTTDVTWYYREIKAFELFAAVLPSYASGLRFSSVLDDDERYFGRWPGEEVRLEWLRSTTSYRTWSLSFRFEVLDEDR